MASCAWCSLALGSRARRTARRSFAVFFSQSRWGWVGRDFVIAHLLPLRPASAAHGQERRNGYDEPGGFDPLRGRKVTLLTFVDARSARQLSQIRAVGSRMAKQRLPEPHLQMRAVLRWHDELELFDHDLDDAEHRALAAAQILDQLSDVALVAHGAGIGDAAALGDQR